MCDFGIMGMWHSRVPHNHHDLHPLLGWKDTHILYVVPIHAYVVLVRAYFVPMHAYGVPIHTSFLHIHICYIYIYMSVCM